MVGDGNRVWTFAPALRSWVAKQLARSSLVRDVDADDIVQQVCLGAVKCAGPLPTSDANLRAYLRSAALRVMSNEHRRQHRLRRDIARRAPVSGTTAIVLVAGQPSPTRTPSCYLEMAELADALRAHVAGLSHNQCRAVQLHHLEGHTIAETAEALGTTELAASALLKRGLTTLRRHLRYGPSVLSDHKLARIA